MEVSLLSWSSPSSLVIKKCFPSKNVYEMCTDGVLESRDSVTAGETEAKKEKNERQTAAVSCSMPSSQLAAEPGTEWRSSGS